MNENGIRNLSNDIIESLTKLSLELKLGIFIFINVITIFHQKFYFLPEL